MKGLDVTLEDVFTGLAVPHGFPRDAMIEAGRQRDGMIPVFLDLIHRLRRAGPDTVAEDDLAVFLFAFFLLGEWRDTRAYRPLASLLRRDSAFLDALLGDAVTEGTARVMAGVFDGDLAPILEVLEDAGADVFVRCQMIDALVMIARSHPQTAAEIHTYLETFAVADLGLAHLEPLVVEAYEMEWISSELSRIEDFRGVLTEATEAGASSWFHESRKTGPIESAIDELSDWYCFSEAYQRDRTASFDGDWLPDLPDETLQREAPKVGRNYPCPCGSGKKFKKCCLH